MIYKKIKNYTGLCSFFLAGMVAGRVMDPVTGQEGIGILPERGYPIESPNVAKG
jgi:hypothetical protein